MDEVEAAGNELASKIRAQFQLSAKGTVYMFLYLSPFLCSHYLAVRNDQMCCVGHVHS